MRFRKPCLALVISALVTMIFCGGVLQAWAAPAATTTILTVASGGNAVASGGSIASGNVVTLTATVAASGNPVTTGQVYFCDASTTYCTDIHLLGTAQLTSAGAATLKFIPGIGSHSYKAVFAGTPNGAMKYAGSASSSAALTVTGMYPTSTAIAQSGVVGNYTLTATMTGSGGTPALSGQVSFPDTNGSNVTLGTVALGTDTAAISWINSVVMTGIDSNGPYVNAIPTVADFNGDGRLDLAMVKDNSMPVALGDGSGGFTQVSNTPVTGANNPLANPSLMRVGDFNGDGKLDAAVSDGDNSVTILLGNGDGTFTQAPASPFSVGSLSFFQALGDFNGDGKLDLAVLTDFPSWGVQILLGNGDGTFTDAPGNTPFGANEISVGIMGTGDFNGDGKLDLVTASLVSGGSGTESVTVLLGNGDGTFTPAPPISAGLFGPVSVALADFNGDGKEDLAIGNSYLNEVVIWLGKGDGTFTQLPSSLTVNYPTVLTVGDFNGDGKVDLVVGTYGQGSDTLTAFLGNGDGTFTTTAAIPETKPVNGLAAGDFKGNGLSDPVVFTNDGDLQVMVSQWTHTATATATGISPLGTGTHLVEASYTGDSNYVHSTSGTTSLTAQQATPTVSATTSSASITTVETLSVTVAVNGRTGYPTPTGTVTLISGGFSSPSAALNNGSATINIPAGLLAAGINTLTLSYSGDSNYIAATGSASVAVTTAVPPSFMVSGTTVTVATPGATTANTSTVTVTPAGGFTGSVVLTAAVTSSPTGALNPPAVSFSSTSPVTITGASAGTATLTVTTTRATSSALRYPMHRGVQWYATGGGTLACVLLLGIPARRRNSRMMLGLLVLFATLAGGVLGCSGSGSSGGGVSTGGATNNPGTTPGNYTVTVTGSSGTITAMGTVTLIVQ